MGGEGERAERDVERVGGSSEVRVEELRPIGHRARDDLGFSSPRHPRVERPRESDKVPLRPERLLEAQRLHLVPGRDLERRLDELRRALHLLLGPRQRRELNEDLGPHDRRVRGGLFDAAEHREERAVGALGAFELAVVARELGQGAKDLRVRRIDPGRGVELHERLRPVPEGEIEPRELVVDGGALLRAAPAEAVDERAENGPRLAVALRGAERLGEREAEGAVVGVEIARLLEERDGRRRRLALAPVQLRRLAQRGEARGLVTGVARRLRQQIGEAPPLGGGAVHRGETRDDLLRRRIARERLLEPRARAVVVPPRGERLRESERDPRARSASSLASRSASR